MERYHRLSKYHRAQTEQAELLESFRARTFPIEAADVKLPQARKRLRLIAGRIPAGYVVTFDGPAGARFGLRAGFRNGVRACALNFDGRRARVTKRDFAPPLRAYRGLTSERVTADNPQEPGPWSCIAAGRYFVPDSFGFTEWALWESANGRARADYLRGAGPYCPGEWVLGAN